MNCFSEIFCLAWRFRAPEPCCLVFRFVARTTLLLLIVCGREVHSVTLYLITIEKSSLWRPQAKMALNRSFTLNNGTKIPAVGFGTWQAKPHEVERAVEVALRSGYRHIDCAAIYRNETEVGEGIRKSGVKREDIWITGKLWNTNHAPEDVEKGLDKTLKDLGVEYLDLFLMHWPT